MKHLYLFENKTEFDNVKPLLEDIWVAMTSNNKKVYCTPINVIITFKDYDGTIISNKIYKRNDIIIIPEIGQGNWPGHTFIGWGDVTIDKAKNNMTFIAQYEVTPKVTLIMDESYSDTAAIALNATKTETVTGLLSFTTDLSSDIAEIKDNVLIFKQHYEGIINVTASALDIHSDIQSDSKSINVYCDVADTVSCVVSDITTPEVKAEATSAVINYTCNVKTTTHAGTSTTVSSVNEKKVEFEANESEEPRDISGTFTCDHGETVNYTVKQDGNLPDEAVDLGLSVKWATCNLGATKPEEYGNLYMSGSTIPNQNCSWANHPFNNGSSSFNSTYFNRNKSKWLDSNNRLKPEYDAATLALGDKWRLPTHEEILELVNGTTNIWTTENSVYGRRFINKNDSSKYIFIPAAGHRSNNKVMSVGSYGYVWSSSFTEGGGNTYMIQFSATDDAHASTAGINHWGNSIRPVYG